MEQTAPLQEKYLVLSTDNLTSRLFTRRLYKGAADSTKLDSYQEPGCSNPITDPRFRFGYQIPRVGIVANGQFAAATKNI